MKISVSPHVVHSDVPVNLPRPLDYPESGVAYGSLAINGDLRSYATADLNGDGFTDIFLHPSYYNLAPRLDPIVLLNDTRGGFYDGTASVFATIPLLEQSNGVYFRDFNGDGRVDMFAVDQGLEIGDAWVGGFAGHANHLYLQGANGVFHDASGNIANNPFSFNHISDIADVNGDGNLDIIIARLGGPALDGSGTLFYLGDGQGNFSFSTAGLPDEIRFMTNAERDWGAAIDFQFSGSSAAGDLDGDGLADLVAGSYTGGDHLTGLQTVRILQQQPDGEFVQKWHATQPAELRDALGVMGVAGINIGDLDGDGLKDVVVRWENHANALQVLKNEGNHVFSDVTHDWLGGYLVRDLNDMSHMTHALSDLIDVNRDGALDLVLRNYGADGNKLAEGASTGAFLLLNDGKGHFSAAVPHLHGRALTGPELAAMAGTEEHVMGMPLVLDANNDGKTDQVFIGIFGGMDESALPYRVTNLHISTFFGEETANIYRATDLGDRLVGSSGRDTFFSGKGADTFDGAGGLDRAVYNGARADFVVQRTDKGAVVDATSGVEGTDTLVNVERVVFGDSSIALDIDGVAGQAYRLYQAAFDRAPDMQGLGYWIQRMDEGTSLDAVAAGFVHSDEFRGLYGDDSSHEKLVNAFYDNVLHRAPEHDGFAYWMDELGSGRHDAVSMLIAFSESAENQAQLIGAIQNGIEYHEFG